MIGWNETSWGTGAEKFMDKILIVEDDAALSAGICYALESEAYSTMAAYSIRKAKQLLACEQFSLAVLDVNLPDGDGFSLCRYIKETIPELKVVFLTANDLEEDVLAGFDLGAEDYITKPFSTNIFRKKIEVVLRNGTKEREASGTVFEDGHLHIDFDSLSCTSNGETVALTPNEYKMLRLLIANAGNIVTRQLMLDRLWDSGGNYIDDHTLTVNITRLRSKIEDAEHAYIKTIRGMGYLWKKG